MKDESAELLKRYRSGQVNALGELVELYRRPLFAFILSMTEGKDDAEEIFQEVWFKAIRGLNGYKSKRFLSWLFRIAHNQVIDRVRKKKPDMSLQDPLGSGEGAQHLQDSIGSEQDLPNRVSGNRELGDRIQQAVNQLPTEQREVFVMRTQSKLAFKEIANIQGTSINTALARMQYAMRKLRELLEEDYASLKGGKL